MTYRDRIENLYFEWLYDAVCGDRFAKRNSFRKLLTQLHGTEFTYVIQRDSNRAGDGVALRYKFSNKREVLDVFGNHPCSVLEMLLGLAMRCETIMDDALKGDRTGQWFWGMITNLGLGSMIDERYDENYVEEVLECFLDRRYEPDGRGGLFTVRNCDRDLRDVEIWVQMCWYLDTIT